MYIPSCVIDYHITDKGHVWIDGTMGGGVETMDCGKYYTAKTVQRALIHYAKRLNKYTEAYLNARR